MTAIFETREETKSCLTGNDFIFSESEDILLSLSLSLFLSHTSRVAFCRRKALEKDRIILKPKPKKDDVKMKIEKMKDDR